MRGFGPPLSFPSRGSDLGTALDRICLSGNDMHRSASSKRFDERWTMATITDVARAAGVSVSTVSYAISGARPIRPETRERIHAAMHRLGFQPNAMARSLASRRSRVIALIYPQIAGIGGTAALANRRRSSLDPQVVSRSGQPSQVRQGQGFARPAHKTLRDAKRLVKQLDD